MAKRTFLSDLDLALNQLIAARLENLASAPTAAVGRVYYNTATKFIQYYDGTAWQDVVIGTDVRLTNSRTPTAHEIINAGAIGALHTISGGVAGYVFKATGATTAQLMQLAHSELSGIGTNTHAQIDTALGGLATTYAPIAKGVTNGDAHDHLGGDGAQIAHSSLSGIGTNTHAQIDTHIADATLHRVINDSSSTTTNLYSASKIDSLISAVNSTITGALVYKGGYDASANSPMLDATPIGGIKQGWTYVVTVAGNFFATPVSPGDMIIATQDSPTLTGHWTIVNKDIPDIVQATTALQGIIQLATQAEVNTGTDANKAVTPATLQSKLGISGTLTPARKFTQTIGDGAALTYAVTHGLGGVVVAQVTRVATPFDEVECEMVATSGTVMTFNFNVAPTSNQFNVTIIG